jgi:hypothetical protein
VFYKPGTEFFCKLALLIRKEYTSQQVTNIPQIDIAGAKGT